MLCDQLQWAAQDNRAHRVALLLAHGVDPAARTAGEDGGPTPYELALRAGNAEIDELLAGAGAPRVALDPAAALAAALMRADAVAVDRMTADDPALCPVPCARSSLSTIPVSSSVSPSSDDPTRWR